MSRTILAAGAVVVREDDDAPRIALVHRPAYDDWTLPKGKPRADEYLPACAVREVLEETGLAVRLGAPLDPLGYDLPDGDRKRVAFWVGHLTRTRRRRLEAEVDEMRWATRDEAAALLTHAGEIPIIDAALAAPPTTPLLIVRHAKALLRRNWKKGDPQRPLSRRGRRQSRGLVPLLGAYGVGSLVTSPSARCAETFATVARRLRLPLVNLPILTEEFGLAEPAVVAQVVAGIAEEAGRRGEPTAVCGHRPVLPTMLVALGIAPRPFGTADTLVAHVDNRGTVVAIEVHPSAF